MAGTSQRRGRRHGLHCCGSVNHCATRQFVEYFDQARANPGSSRRNRTTSRWRGRVRPANDSIYRWASGRSQRQGLPSVRLARAVDLFDGWFAGEKRAGERAAKRRFGMADDGGMLQRVSPCVSRSAQSRSVAHATKAQFFTIPWGNPREAQPNPRADPAKLGAFRRRGMIARFAKDGEPLDRSCHRGIL